VNGEMPVMADPSPYSSREKVARLAWAVVQSTLFAWSFHTCHGWRRMLLRAFGASLHPTCRIRRTVRIECPWNLTIGMDTAIGDGAILYCLGPVRIGDHATVSQRAHVCAGSHDHRSRSMVLLRPPITIGSDCWIAAEAFVGPGTAQTVSARDEHALSTETHSRVRRCRASASPPWPREPALAAGRGRRP